MNTIFNTEISDDDLQNKKYKFQLELTSKLDIVDTDFTQEIINEIVLWKVNRYSKLEDDTLDLLNKIEKSDKNIDIDLTKSLLKKLLNTKGIKLAMASTILRFKNPNIYQIIDQRVFRFIYPEKNLTKISNNQDDQIEIYLEYLKDLRNICNTKNIKFELADRILYALDKEVNKKNTIKG